jgi:hypothetical protein
MGLDTMHVCVLLEFDERFYGGIDYCKCVFCWNLVTVYVLGLIIACVCVCSCWNHVSLLEPNDKLCVLQWICDLLLNCVFCSEFMIRFWNCIACSEIVICCRNWVVCSELAFAAKLCVLEWICDSVPKLYCRQWNYDSLSKLSCL